VSNVATVSAPAGVTDPAAGNNSATDTDAIAAVADLSVVKTNGEPEVTAGATTTYTVVVTNEGPSAGDGAVVTDAAVAGLTKTGVSCAAAGGAVCPSVSVAGLESGLTIATLPSGGSLTLTMTATVTAFTGSVSNVATIAASGGVTDPNASNNSATDTDTVTPMADLSLTKTDGVSAVDAGGTTTYTVEVTNAGPSAADGAVVTDAAAAGLTKTGVSCAASGGAACPASPTVAQIESGLAIPTLPSGGRLTFTITATVTATAGSVTNVAAVAAPAGVTDPAAANDSATDTNTVGAAADLSITKTNGVTGVTAGATTTYTIVVTNLGPSPVIGAAVSDSAPAGLTFGAWTCVASAGSACPATGTGDITVTVDLLSGGTATFTLPGTIGSATTGTLTNTATVNAPVGVTDPQPSNNTASDSDPVSPAPPILDADLLVTKTNGTAAVIAGGTTTYTVMVTNAGPSAADGAAVADAAAAGLAKTGVSCSAAGGAVCPGSPTVAQIESSLAVPTLPSGGSVTFTITATVTAASGSVSNSAAAAVPSGVTDPNTANNAATDTDTVSPAPPANADLAVSKTDGAVSVNAGATTTYTVVVTNAGPGAADGATITDAAAAGLTKTAVSCAAAGGAVCPASPTVAQVESGLAIPALPSGGSITLTVTATITANSGSVSNVATAAVPGGMTDPNAANNTATDTDAVLPAGPSGADLTITNTNGLGALTSGAIVTYTLVASNIGPAPANGAVVTSPAVPGLTGLAVSCAASGGAICPASPTLAQIQAGLAIPTLPAGGSVTFTVTARVTAESGTVTSTATVAPPAGVADPVPANNSASDTDPVGPAVVEADLAVSKSNGVTMLTPGQATTYTIVVTNAGPSTAAGATVTDTAPAGLIFGPWTCSASAGSSCPAAGSGNLAAAVTLIAGGSATFTLNATVAPWASGSLTNTATVASPAGARDPNSANNTAADTDTIEPQRVGIAKEAGTPVVVAPTAFEVSFTIVAANVGSVPLTNLQVTDLLSQAFRTGGPAISISGPVVASPGGGAADAECVANPAFTGVGAAAGASTNLLSGNGTLAPNQSCTMRFAVRVTYPDAKSVPGAAQYNSASARTYAAPGAGVPLATDHSDSGPSPSGTNAGAPGDTGGSDDPTPVRFVLPRVDITKALGEVQQVDDTTFDVGFSFVVKNTGEVSAANLQVTDNLAATFSAGQPAISIEEGPSAVAGSATLTFAQGEKAYNGSTQTAMLAGTDTLAPGAEARIAIKARLRYTSPSVIPAGQEQKNTATATTAVSPGGAVVSRDDSTDVTETGADPVPGDAAAPTILRLMPRPRLTIEKTVNTGSAEIGDSLLYTVRVHNAGGPFFPETTMYDRLPLGFRYIAGTARTAAGGTAPQRVPDPAGGAGPLLTFTIPSSASSAEVVITYRVRVGPGALQGDGINTVEAASGDIVSNVARAGVVVTGGVFTTDACVAGKIFVDCNDNQVQDPGEVGIPGVRVVFEDGTALVSDVEGKYSYCGLPATTHVLKVDRTTLPVGSQLTTSSNRNAGDAGSLFVDLKFGELHRADFLEGSCSERVLSQVMARRSQGEIWMPILDGTDQGMLTSRGRGTSQPVPAQRWVSSPQGTGAAWQMPGTQTPAAQTPAGRTSDVIPANAAPLPNAGQPVQAPATPRSGDRPSLFAPLDQAAGLSSATSNLPDDRPQALSQAQARAGRVALTVDRAMAPADGRAAVEVRLQLSGADGAPLQEPVVVTVETSGGRIRLPGRSTDEAGPGRGDEDPLTDGTQVRVERGVFAFQVVAPSGAQDVTVRATAGSASAQALIAFVPDLRPMLAVGVLEGMVGITKVGALTVGPARPNEAFDRELRRFSRSFDDGQGIYGGRAALFLKGTARQQYLFTLAYDSDKDSRGVLFRDIQPEAFYPVYGDASLKGFDAQTSGRFYARVDRGRSYVLFGDLQTAVSRTEARDLGVYNRTLTGLQHRFETSRTSVNAFASRDTLKQIVDEFAALGVSGPYSVSNPNGVSGTEKVEIITRDRNQPAVVLSRVSMTRYADYEFEPFSGRLVFRRPVSAVDERLNPVSIRITYEVDQGGEAYWVTGVDGQVKLGRRLEVGGSWNEDVNPLAPYRLSSVSAIARLGQHTSIVAEGARTTSTVNSTAVNAAASANASQAADEVEGNAARVEFRHESRKLQARLFAGTSDPAFNNPAASLNGGRTEAGARGAVHFSDSLHLVGEAIHSEDRLTGGEQDGALLTIESRLSRLLTAEFGVRRAKEARGAAQGTSAGISPFPLAQGPGFGLQSTIGAIDPVTGLTKVNAGFTPTLSAGAGSSKAAEPIDVLTLRGKLTAKFGEAMSLYGEAEQDLRDADKQLAAVGGDVRLRERIRLYARHEFISSLDGPYALNSQQRSYHTVFGVSSSYVKDGDLFSEYRVRDAISGREAEAAIGLRNLWTLARGVRLSTSLERLQAVSSLDRTATAASVGLEYTRHPLFKGTGRAEWRHDESADSWLSTIGLARKIGRDWTLLAKNYYQLTSPKQAEDQVQDRFWTGVAFRDTDTNKLNVLSRYEFKYEKLPGLAGETLDQRVHVVSTHADYHPRRRWTFEGQYGAKWVGDRTDPSGSRFSAHLMSGRVIYDVSNRWDIGVLGSVLWSRDAGRQYAAGAEIGYRLVENVWLSAGYNFTGFNDRDLSLGNYTARGAFVRVRAKFDETMLDRLRGKKK
jgi:uncharacterized repeat protein (TIGR01451 family)